MDPAAVVTWLSAGTLAYTYVGYPLAIAAAAKLFGRPLDRRGEAPDGATVVIAVRNERDRIEPRVRELARHLVDAGVRGEIIVAVNGSTDGTVEAAQKIDLSTDSALDQITVQVIQTDPVGGKAAAVSAAVAASTMPAIVLADARQRWGTGAVKHLLGAMRDPAVGGVSGELILEQSPGVMAGVGAYWRYEKWIRRSESRYGCQIGVTGAIAAVRRECFRTIPPGTILDDVYWPLQVAMAGRRVVMVDDAVAYDRLPENAAGELRRKVRTLAGNFQLVAMQPKLLLPVLNPVWARFVSHKLLRLACPWAMAALILAGPLTSPLGTALSITTLAILALGLIELKTSLRHPRKLLSAAGSFVLLNYAALLATYATLRRRSHQLW